MTFREVPLFAAHKNMCKWQAQGSGITADAIDQRDSPKFPDDISRGRSFLVDISRGRSFL